jgi:hypothetical protein
VGSNEKVIHALASNGLVNGEVCTIHMFLLRLLELSYDATGRRRRVPGTKRNNFAHPSIRIIIYDALNMASTVAAVAAATARALTLSSCLLFLLPGQISQPAIQPHYEIGHRHRDDVLDRSIYIIPSAGKTDDETRFVWRKKKSC